MSIDKDKIDIIYCWVDGNDPAWREKRDYWAKKENPNSLVLNNCRSTDNDELKYSLRSLEINASWINKIYIITDNQVPKWLKTNNQKVKVIDIKEIIPEEYLPTFNSNTIEHFLTNIPDLSEYFLYACDDMFFLRKVSPSFFFTNNKYPIIRLRNCYGKSMDTQYDKACIKADCIIKKYYNFELKIYPHHNIDAYKKSDIIDCRSIFENDLLPTFSNKFRAETDIQRKIYSNYALAIKHGKYKRILEPIPMYAFYKYIPLLRKTVRNYNEHFTQETMYICPHYTDYNTLKMNPNTKLFCINDDEKSDNQDRINSKKFLNMLFPEKSSFEL